MAVYRKEYFSNEVKEIVKPDVNEIKSRYDTKMRLRMSDDRLIIRRLKKDDLVAEVTAQDTIHTVTPVEVGRPENLALTYYGDARLYWVILAANNLRDRTELTDGLIITIPAIKSLYSSNGLLLR